MQRVTDLADPRRCKGASLDGQCQNVAEEGIGLLPRPRRQRSGTRSTPEAVPLDQGARQARLAQLDDPEGLKSLREEVVVATGQLERRLNLANRRTPSSLPPIPRSRGR